MNIENNLKKGRHQFNFILLIIRIKIFIDFKVFNMTGQMIGANLSGSYESEIVGSEIQVFPLGFTLVKLNGSEKEKNINSGLDITNWFNAKDCQQKKEFSLRTYTKYQPFPYYISGVIPTP